jgi:hypothetical protein
MTTLTKVLVGLGLLALLLWHPFTRSIIFTILPLGRGIDDIAFWVVAVLFLFVAFLKGWINMPKIKRFFENIESEEKSDY